MKPYGREKKLTGHTRWKKDYHPRPKRIYMNWWEDIVDVLPRTTMKANTRKQINREILEDEDNPNDNR